MKLYGSYTSPFVRHCRIALIQSGLDFEFVETDYAMSAERSPTSKVPFLEDSGVMLTDSSSIIKYAREKSGKAYLSDVEDQEMFAMTNTVLDSAINLFLLENDGITPDQSSYLTRQKDRVESGLDELNRRFDPSESITKDSALRCACFIDWALFRNRINIDKHDNLVGLLAAANKVEEFVATAPPGR